MTTHIRHIRSPEAAPRRPDHPRFGDQAGSLRAQAVKGLRKQWERLVSSATQKIRARVTKRQEG